jgi:hypothetical protein
VLAPGHCARALAAAEGCSLTGSSSKCPRGARTAGSRLRGRRSVSDLVLSPSSPEHY